MEHFDYSIDILDETGKVIGQKTRRDIDKRIDCVSVAYSLVCNPKGELILAKVSDSELYGGRWGVTAATIIRHGETPTQAAERSLAYDLELEHPILYPLGRDLVKLDGVSRLISSFFARTNATFGTLFTDELQFLSPEQIDQKLATNPEKFTPTLKYLWGRYQEKLPF